MSDHLTEPARKLIQEAATLDAAGLDGLIRDGVARRDTATTEGDHRRADLMNDILIELTEMRQARTDFSRQVDEFCRFGAVS